MAASSVFDRPINGKSFAAYVREILVPALVPGEIVVLDKLGSHKGAEVRGLIREAGCHLAFLPPYSPDLNPIEHAFVKVKAHLRKAAARSLEEIWDAIASLLSPSECTQLLPQRRLRFHFNGKALGRAWWTDRIKVFVHCDRAKENGQARVGLAARLRSLVDRSDQKLILVPTMTVWKSLVPPRPLLRLLLVPVKPFASREKFL